VGEEDVDAAASAAAAADWKREDAALIAVPPGSRGKEISAIPLPEALEAACAGFETAAGGRAALIEHLSHAPLDQKQELLVGAIADPRNDSISLARICQLYGIKFSALLGLFRDAGFAKAQLTAMQKVWGYTPQLAEDVMLRALPHDLPCGACLGEGKFTRPAVVEREGKKITVEETRECEACRGRGSVLQQPERAQQELALKLAGLIQPAGAQPSTVVNVSQKTAVGIAAAGGGGVFASFVAASDKVLYPGRAGAAPAPAAAPATPAPAAPADDPVDAEVVDPFEAEAGEILGEEP
jgi:hypothetical protein